ncbi:MAG: SOS response-associated peptidase [Azonexaceae bacterium]|nr:SOS response-associated peptidase [Azonexaceae bacterium]
MCGCYELKARIRALNRRFPQLHPSHGELPRSGEMHPNDPVLMVTAGTPGFVGSLARWGLVGSFLDQPPRSPLLTLPAEGLASKPFYSKILKRNRCLIPATAFHECQTLVGGKQQMRISEASGELLIFAGIFDHHPLAGTTCAILTTAADATVGRIHSRMPVILDRDESSFWLSDHADFPEAEFAAILDTPSRHALTMEAIIEAEPSPQLSLAFA